jgi:hypothetical protein
VFSLCLFSAGVLGGRHMPVFSQICMICELSQIFLNIRNILGKNNNSLIASVNKVLFFVSYTFLRVIGFPYLIWVYYESTKLYNFWNVTPIIVEGLSE